MEISFHNDNYSKLLYLCLCMRNKVRKVKRPHIKWNDVRLELEDPRVNCEFYRLLQKHPKMSKDRISWNALKHYYSTTSLARYRWLGVPLS